MAAEVNSQAPDFVLFDTKRETVSLDAFRGKKVVIAFFPAAFTGVCEAELCTFQDSLTDLNDLNATVVAISVDSPFSNAAFTEKNKIKYPILSDYARSTINAYGVMHDDFSGMPGYVAAKRSIFVVDERGMIVYKWVAEHPGKEPIYEEIKVVLGE